MKNKNGRGKERPAIASPSSAEKKKEGKTYNSELPKSENTLSTLRFRTHYTPVLKKGSRASNEGDEKGDDAEAAKGRKACGGGGGGGDAGDEDEAAGEEAEEEDAAAAATAAAWSGSSRLIKT